MNKKKGFLILCMSVAITAFSACAGRKEEGMDSVNPSPMFVQDLEVAENEHLEKLCEKVKQLYMVEPVQTGDNTEILIYELAFPDDADVLGAKGEFVVQYQLPCKLSDEDVYNFYYDGEIFAVADGVWKPEQPEVHNNHLVIWVSWDGKDFERLEVGETKRAYQSVYFGFGANGRIALITEIDMRVHEVFLRADADSEWKNLGTAESFGDCYDRRVNNISFFDETTGVVGTPLVDPAYTNFIRTDDGGDSWEFAEKELLEETGTQKKYGYYVLNLQCEGELGAALVEVSLLEDERNAFYLYTTTDKGKTWKIAEKVK